MAKTPKKSFLEKANAVTKLWHTPCKVPWIIYAETLFPILGNAVMRLFTFGTTDIIRGFARPAAVRTKHHFRRGEKNWRRKKGIPELGNLVGRSIPGQEEFAQRKVSDGVKHLWIIDGFIQRALLYWLIADIVNDAQYIWSSAIMERACGKEPQFGDAYCKSDDNITLFSVADSWITPPSGNIIYQDLPTVSRFAAHWNGGKPFSCYTGISAIPWLIPGGFIQIGVKDDNGQEIILGSGKKNEFQNVGAMVESWGAPVIFDYRTNGGSFLGTVYSVTFGFG